VSWDRMWNLACLFVGDVLCPVQRPRTKPCCKGRKNLASHYQGTRRRAVNVSDLSSARIYMISQHNLDYCFAAQISGICSEAYLLRLIAAVGFEDHLANINDVGILVRITRIIVAKLADDYTAFLSPCRLSKLHPSADIAQSLPVR
jgi:hypothetical protein